MKRVIILIWDAAAILKICSKMQLQLTIQSFLRLCYLSAGIITCRIEINVWYWSFINVNKNDTDKEFPNMWKTKSISLWMQVGTNIFLTSFFWEVSIVKHCWHHMLYSDGISFCIIRNCQKIRKIDENSIFWTTGEISMKFSGKM